MFIKATTKDKNATPPSSQGKKSGIGDWKLFGWRKSSSTTASNNKDTTSSSNEAVIVNEGKEAFNTPSMEKLAINDTDGSSQTQVPPEGVQTSSTPLPPIGKTPSVVTPLEQPKFTPNVKTSAAALVTPHEAMVCAKRVKKEYEDLYEECQLSPLPNLYIAMDPNDHLKWYVLIHSLTEDCYQQGEYLFHVELSPRYPFAPPDFYFFTPNGRFEIQRKLCFSNSSYHTEMWSPIWKIKTIIVGFLSFFLEKDSKGLGHLQQVSDEKKREYAESSKVYNEEHYSEILKLIRQQNQRFMI